MEDRSPASGDTSGQELEPIEAEFVLPERISDKLVVPFTGELVHLGEPAEVARALESVRQAKYQLDDARRVLEDALWFASEQAGSRTLHLGELDAVVSGGDKVVYDELELARRLRAAGLPEERLSELIVETVTYKVDARVAKSVAASNPKYAEAIEASRRTVPAPVRVAIKRGGTR
jgi:hypothetical protein